MNNEFIISFDNFIIDTIIGILPNELINPQRIIVNISITYVSKDGSILDYSEIYNMILHIFNSNHFDYLENAILFIIDSIKNKFVHLNRIYINIKKPDILSKCMVSVSREAIFDD